MLRMSYSNHFLSVVHPSIHFQKTSPRKPLSQFCSNFIWSLLRLGERKIAKMAAVHWPGWPPCPYMVKTFKNLLLQNRECLAQIIGDRRSTKVAKMMVIHWCLTFLQRGRLLPYVFIWAPYIVWEKCWEFQPPLKPLGQCCSNFTWSLFGAGEWKIAQIVAVHWLRWLPCPYMVKTFKNLLQNRGCLGAETLHKLSGTGGLPRLLKWWSYIDFWPFYNEVKLASLCICMGPIHLYLLKWWSYIDVWSFYGEVKFASLCICMGPIHLYGKNVENFKWLLLWSLWANVAQISCGASLGQGNERLLKL